MKSGFRRGGSLFMWARATEQRRGSSGGRKEQGLRPSVGRSELGHPERPIQEHEALPFYWEGFTWVPVGVVWAQPSSVGRSSARTHTCKPELQPRARMHRMPEYAGIPDKQWKDVQCNYVSITAWDTLTKKKKKKLFIV